MKNYLDSFLVDLQCEEMYSEYGDFIERPVLDETNESVCVIKRRGRIFKDGRFQNGIEQIAVCKNREEADAVMNEMYLVFCEDQYYLSYKDWAEDYIVDDDIVLD